MKLENKALCITFDTRSGAFTQIANRITGHKLIERASDGPPWRIYLSRPNRAPRLVDEYASCRVRRAKSGQVWKLVHGISIKLELRLPARALNAELWVNVENKGEQTIETLELPILGSIAALSKNVLADRLATSLCSGLLIKYPLYYEPFQALQKLYYPSGFAGHSLQVLAYFEEGKGGFYVACHDPHNTTKRFSFGRAGEVEDPQIRVEHLNWILAPGASMKLDYPIVIGALQVGDWREAAERYRAWATSGGPGHPDWCHRGTLADRVKKGTASRWLSEEVGFCTFGLPSAIDISPWFRAVHRIADVPVLHVLGHDWKPMLPPGGDDAASALRMLGVEPKPWQIRKVEGWAQSVPLSQSRNPHCLSRMAAKLKLPLASFPVSWLCQTAARRTGSNGVMPLNFSPENLAVIHRQGDCSAQFEFDFFPPSTGASGIFFPEGLNWDQCGLKTNGRSPWGFRFVCPIPDECRRVHRERDVSAVRAGMDANYYDISMPAFSPLRCDDPRHGHALGNGREIIAGYQHVYEDTKKATSRARGEYVPQGTEVMTETYISQIDFAQWRAGGGPQGDMENNIHMSRIKLGLAEPIPFFNYVYHEYGPVKNGWFLPARPQVRRHLLLDRCERNPRGRPARAELRVFAARELPGHDRLHLPARLSLPLHRGKKARPDRSGKDCLFKKDVARARVGFGRQFLCYGRMVRPLAYLTPPPAIKLSWQHYNDIGGRREGAEYSTSSIVQQAWQAQEGAHGFFFVNLAPRAQQIDVMFDPATHHLGTRPLHAVLVSNLHFHTPPV
jgi:hypothetical protein